MKPILTLTCCLIALAPASIAAPPPPAPAPPPPLEAAAKIAKAEYCFAVDRQLRPERNPPPTLVARLQFDVSYRNTATRPIILPWQYERTVYTALTPGVMKPVREFLGLFTPSVVMMMRLPANVNPLNPVDPPNDEFRVIPPGGTVNLPVIDLVTLPVFKQSRPNKVDVRGKNLYVRLKLKQRELAPDLEAQLSDKWARFGVPWTGSLLTNTLTISVPALPTAQDCVDTRNPQEGKDVDKSLKLQR